MPKITVGILTFNRKERVLKAIQSAYDQNFPGMEVLVVDSNSQDGTADAVRERFPDARVIRLPRNIGCPGGRNHLYANAFGDYIINLDDDGWLGEGAIRMVYDAFESDALIGIVAMRQCYPEDNVDASEDAAAGTREVGLFKGGVSAFRKSMLDDIGCYPEEFFFFKEEEDLSIRALNAGFKILYRPDIIMWHPRYGPSGSEDISWDYYRFRNPLLVVARLFPAWLMLKYLVLRTGSYFLLSIKRGSLHKWFAAVLSVAWHMPRMIWNRKPCSAQAVHKFFKLRFFEGGAK